jgi:hypothetical protein
MAMGGPKIAVIRLNIETGEVIDCQAENGGKVEEGDNIKDEIRGKKPGDYETIAEIKLTPASAGCLYWDGQRWIKWC